MSVVIYLFVLGCGIAASIMAVELRWNPALFSLSLFATALVLGLSIERVAAYRPVRRGHPSVRVESTNSVLNLLLGFALGGVIHALLLALQKQVFRVEPGFAGDSFGPLWLQALLAFAVMDLVRYFVHLLQHRIPWLWELHKTHHTIQEVRLSNVLFAHPADYVPRLVFPVYLPLVAGVRPEAIVIAQALVTILGLMSHISVPPRFGFLNLVFATSEVHRFHHNVIPAQGGDRNFGIGTIVWDRLFGTFYSDPAREAPELLGTDVPGPQTFFQTVSLGAHRASFVPNSKASGPTNVAPTQP